MEVLFCKNVDFFSKKSSIFDQKVAENELREAKKSIFLGVQDQKIDQMRPETVFSPKNRNFA